MLHQLALAFNKRKKREAFQQLSRIKIRSTDERIIWFGRINWPINFIWSRNVTSFRVNCSPWMLPRHQRTTPSVWGFHFHSEFQHSSLAWLFFGVNSIKSLNKESPREIAIAVRILNALYLIKSLIDWCCGTFLREHACNFRSLSLSLACSLAFWSTKSTHNRVREQKVHSRKLL